MIDTTMEELTPLTQAADEQPRRRRGRKTHVSTLYRWATVGCRGVQLETIQVGASRCTTREALQRFFERLSADPTRSPESVTPARSIARRARESAKAGETLEKQGG
jgi:hypothetical protein